MLAWLICVPLLFVAYAVFGVWGAAAAALLWGWVIFAVKRVDTTAARARPPGSTAWLERAQLSNRRW